MDSPIFYAHSGSLPDKSDWQRLDEHLASVGKLAGEFSAVFGAEAMSRAAGLLHDLGKYTEQFQRRLSGDYGRVDHSTWGARLAIERYGQAGKLLAYGIAGHHAGLANGRDAETRTALADRLKSELPLLLSAWDKELQLPAPIDLLPRGFTPDRDLGQFQLAFLARMIFSSLVDADFLDTEAFYAGLEGRDPGRHVEQPSLRELRKELEKTLSSFRADSSVNRIRAEILAGVRAKSVERPGIFSLTVPTGGGKTLASLAFALDHAIRHDLRRVIYVIPFTSIVEQNAAVFRRALGPLGERAVLEHHSAFVENTPAKATPDEYQGIRKLRLAMENWDAPVVVTTAVQFFESLFADRPSHCRKLHNIAGSVVILDEAQTLPLKLLRPTVASLKELACNYRTSIVLCTATQPALKASDEFAGGFQDVRELAPDPSRLYRELKRVQLRHLGPQSDEDLARYLTGRNQILCIVNNRRHARALYESIADQPGACHLTTLMCARHRSQVLAEVRHRLAHGAPCRLVATSLIEAGVDVDFPVVLRAEAGLDSIAQAAGRCNREGRRPAAESEVLVFSVENEDWAPPPELKQFAQVARAALRRHHDDPLAMDAVNGYFRELYWQKGPRELDAHDLLGMHAAGIDALPFESVATRYRMIESLQMPVIVPFDDDARVALRELAFVPAAGGIARRLQPYVVQVPKNAYEALRNAGAIFPVEPNRFGEQFMQLANLDIYHSDCGLMWQQPDFIRAESLTW